MIYTQYSNADNLKKFVSIIENVLKFDYISFINDYLDISKANTDGLNTWGIILNLPRTIKIEDASDEVFGFSTQEQYPISEFEYGQNFNNGRFYNDKYQNRVMTKDLDDYSYRIILLMKYQTITSNCSLEAANRIVNDMLQKFSEVYGTGKNYKCSVISDEEMVYKFKFNFILTRDLRAIMNDRSIIPIPAGVRHEILEQKEI